MSLDQPQQPLNSKREQQSVHNQPQNQKEQQIIKSKKEQKKSQQTKQPHLLPYLPEVLKLKIQQDQEKSKSHR